MREPEEPSRANWSARPIALAGFMGVGKSSIGRVLAARIDRQFIDSDSVVAERLGTSIATAFRIDGEARFRQMEAAVIEELVDEVPPKVIALGGGALGDPATLTRLRERALLVHLRLSWEALEPLIPKLRRGRPLLEGATTEEVHALYLSRDELYSSCHLTVELRREGVRRSAAYLLAALEPYGIKEVDDSHATTASDPLAAGRVENGPSGSRTS